MPNSDPRDGFFYSTLMVHILTLWYIKASYLKLFFMYFSVPIKKKSPLKTMKKKKQLTNPDFDNLLDANNSLADDEDLALKLLNK